MLVRHAYGARKAALFLGTAMLCSASVAGAVPCASLNLPNPIYGSGGSAITATLGKVATALSNLPDPITVLFADPGACAGYKYFLDGDIAAASIKYWDAAGVQQTCEPAVPQPADFAHMGNTADFCANLTLPSGVGDFLGPIQTLNLITDKDSSQKSISAEALYYIFGLGAQTGNVAPWTTDAYTVGRTTNSFVHLFLAASIQVPPTGFHVGFTAQTNQETVLKVAEFGATNPEAPIGYVSGSAADQGRATIKTLAYQHTGQLCGYWPDSTEDALDKRNVRNGQYHFWTPGHFFAAVNSAGRIVNPLVRDLVGWFDGSVAPPSGLDVTRIVIESGDIPQCATRVKREGVLGAISSFAPPEPCGCYFESIATRSVPAACTACDVDTACGGDVPKCRFGFCEAY